MTPAVIPSVARNLLVNALAGLVIFATMPWVASAQQTRGATIPVRAGTVLDKYTVLVGYPFLVKVRIQAPAGSAITFPDAPDSASTVQALDPVKLDSVIASAAVEYTATYRVAAWDIDRQPIVLKDVIVRNGDAQRAVPLTGLSVFVRSVLPADTAKRIPKPARPIYEFSPPMWWLWALLAAIAIAIGLAYWWWRRRKRRPKVVIPADPYAHAEQEFARIEKLGLVEAGERGRFVALMVEVLRDYLAARYPDANLALTSTELLAVARGERAIPHDRLRRLLEEADLVKFARRPLSADRARELGKEARGVVGHEHAASRPPAQEAAA